MTPRVMNRGYSFNGLFAYLMHDKDHAETSDRVGWTHYHNIPANDPDGAMRWLAFNSMNAEKFKQEYAHLNGTEVEYRGANASGKNVYHYSLAWHPEENPDKDHMLKSVLETLDVLGLTHHPVFITSHVDEPQPHVHVATSLVDPYTGKTKTMSKDHVHLSEWANDYEKEHGIYCKKRVENNKQRQEEKKFVKHRSRGFPQRTKQTFKIFIANRKRARIFRPL